VIVTGAQLGDARTPIETKNRERSGAVTVRAVDA
jgi:hypothetical protein